VFVVANSVQTEVANLITGRIDRLLAIGPMLISNFFFIVKQFQITQMGDVAQTKTWHKMRSEMRRLTSS